MLISIVDDDEDFCRAIERWTDAILEKRPEQALQLKVHKSGHELFQFLQSIDSKTKTQIIILLDLAFDGKKTAGLDALLRIKQSNRKVIRRIPVVIYSNSDDPSEIEKSYLHFASSFVWKGNGFNQQKKKYLELVSYWMETATGQPPLGGPG